MSCKTTQDDMTERWVEYVRLEIISKGMKMNDLTLITKNVVCPVCDSHTKNK